MHTLKLNDHIQTLSKNKIPKDNKGNDYTLLEYDFVDYKILNNFLDSVASNTEFKGELILKSKLFDELLGYKIAKVLKNSKLTVLRIENKNSPFNDKVTTVIGNALAKNTTLKNFDSYFDIDNTSASHIFEFLTNPNSQLQSIKYIKMTSQLFDYLIQHLNKESSLKCIGFYFIPFEIPNLLYSNINLILESIIPESRYSLLAEKIETSSNVTNVDIISIKEEYYEEINKKLCEDIFKLHRTLEFSCEINKKEIGKDVDIENVYNSHNSRMNRIL
jgi:hypothetical protein